jgi:hypothetical protein
VFLKVMCWSKDCVSKFLSRMKCTSRYWSVISFGVLEASSQVRNLFPLIHCFLSQQHSTPRLLVLLHCVQQAVWRCELRTGKARIQRKVPSRLTNTQIKNNGIPVLKDFCLKKGRNWTVVFTWLKIHTLHLWLLYCNVLFPFISLRKNTRDY